MKFMYSILVSCLLCIGQAQATDLKLYDATSFDPQPVVVSAADNSVPVGTVIIWTKEEIPEGWLECNGQPVPDMYSDLKDLMPVTPNYQGMFLRGAGSQIVNHGGYGSVTHGTELGKIQGDTIRNAQGTFELRDNVKPMGVFTNTTGVFSAYGGGNNWRIRATEGNVAQKTLLFNFANMIPTSKENRPVNVGVKYIIKAE